MAPHALATLDDVKARLGIPDDNTDAELSAVLDSATTVLQNLYGDVIPAQYTETLRPYGDGSRMLTGRAPLLSVDSITVTWPYPSSPTISLSTNLYFADLATGQITVYAFSPAFAWQYAPRDWSTARFLVTYTAGRATVAANVKDALLDLVQFWWRQSRAAGTQTYGEDAGVLPAAFGIPNAVIEKLSMPPRQIA